MSYYLGWVITHLPGGRWHAFKGALHMRAADKGPLLAAIRQREGRHELPR